MKAWLCALLAASLGALAQPARRSGFEDMTPAVQALQRDDALNPALLWVKAGEQHFAAHCAGCHGPDHLRGVAARYPAWDAPTGRPLTLAARIQQCQLRQVPGAHWPPEDERWLGLQAYVAMRSRGSPIAPPDDARLAPWREQGRRLWQQRIGQLDLSCADCHDAQAGRRLGGSTVPQGHPTGYPIYRLEWQGVGSLQRRLRGCMSGVRAEPWAWGSAELTALELFLMQRAAGMTMEGPAVRP